jgi:hypothetical protein
MLVDSEFIEVKATEGIQIFHLDKPLGKVVYTGVDMMYVEMLRRRNLMARTCFSHSSPSILEREREWRQHPLAGHSLFHSSKAARLLRKTDTSAYTPFFIQ